MNNTLSLLQEKARKSFQHWFNDNVSKNTAVLNFIDLTVAETWNDTIQEAIRAIDTNPSIRESDKEIAAMSLEALLKV